MNQMKDQHGKIRRGPTPYSRSENSSSLDGYRERQRHKAAPERIAPTICASPIKWRTGNIRPLSIKDFDQIEPFALDFQLRRAGLKCNSEHTTLPHLSMRFNPISFELFLFQFHLCCKIWPTWIKLHENDAGNWVLKDGCKTTSADYHQIIEVSSWRAWFNHSSATICPWLGARHQSGRDRQGQDSSTKWMQPTIHSSAYAI